MNPFERISREKQLLSKLKRFTKEKRLTDITLKVQGKEYPCHKVILCAASTYFDRMFCGDFKEANSSVVELFGCSDIGFDEIYKYVYSADFDLTEENAIDVYDATDMFLFDDMKRRTHSFLMMNVNETNCLKYLLFAHERGILELSEKCKLIQIHHFDDVCFWNEHLLLELPYELLLEIITSEYLCCQDEENLLAIIYSWIRHNNASYAEKNCLFDKIKWGIFEEEDIDEILQFYSDFLPQRYLMWKSLLKEHSDGNCNERICLEKKHKYQFERRGFKSILRVGGRQRDYSYGHFLYTIRWRFADAIGFITLPKPICDTAAVTVGNHLFVIGGKITERVERFKIDSNANVASDVLAYDLKFCVWQRLSPLNWGRWEHVAVSFGDYILVVGGRDEKGGMMDCVEKYDIKEDKWIRMKPFKKWTRLVGCCLDDEVYVCGGRLEGPTSKSCPACHLNGYRSSYIVEGGGKDHDCVFISGRDNYSIYKYDTVVDNWNKVYNIPRKYRDFRISSMAVHNGNIYMGSDYKCYHLVFNPVKKSLEKKARTSDIMDLSSDEIIMPYRKGKLVCNVRSKF